MTFWMTFHDDLDDVGRRWMAFWMTLDDGLHGG